MANAKKYGATNSAYLKPDDLDGPISVKILNVFESTDYNNKDCLVLELDNEKKFQLNTTNVNSMIEIHGEETDEWIEKEIGLNPGTYSFKSKDGEEKSGPTILVVASDDLPF